MQLPALPLFDLFGQTQRLPANSLDQFEIQRQREREHLTYRVLSHLLTDYFSMSRWWFSGFVCSNFRVLSCCQQTIPQFSGFESWNTNVFMSIWSLFRPVSKLKFRVIYPSMSLVSFLMRNAIKSSMKINISKPLSHFDNARRREFSRSFCAQVEENLYPDQRQNNYFVGQSGKTV